MIACTWLAGALVIASSTAGPSIVADGDTVTIVGGVIEFTLPTKTVSVGDILSDIAKIKSDLLEQSEEDGKAMGTLTGRVTAVELSIKEVAASADSNTGLLAEHTSSMEALSSEMSDQQYKIDAIGSAVDAAVAEFGEKLKSVVESIGADVTGNKASIDAAIAALGESVEKIRHPRAAVVYGDWIFGDDEESLASCPDDLPINRCTVEWKGDFSEHPGHNTDGIRVEAKRCIAFAANDGGTIRVKVECSDLHNKVEVVADDAVVTADGKDHIIACPEGTRALHCHCYSPWKHCGRLAWGFTPSTDTTCSAAVSGGSYDGRRILSVICVDSA